MKYNVIILGATGMVGEGVLHIALEHRSIESILVIGRSPCGVSHPKVKEIVHTDFFDLTPIERHLSGFQACYFCLGTTSVGKTIEAYTRTTYDLTMNVARTLARLNPSMTFCYVSGLGTDSTEKGRIAWARIKGKTENELLTLPFKAVYNFRPGFIKPIRGLRHGLPISGILGLFYPLLKIIFPNGVCTLEEVGRSMISVTEHGHPSSIIDNRAISLLGAR